MSFKMRLICTMAALFLFAMPMAAESWIIQSLNQDIEHVNGNGCLQNSIQISGIERGDLFHIQQLNQKQEEVEPDGTDASFVIQRVESAPRDFSAADLIEIMEDISSRGEAKGINFCRMDIDFLDCLPIEMDMDSEDGLQKMDMNNSREAISRLDLIMAKSWHNPGNAPEDGYHILLLSNGTYCSIAPGFLMVKEVDLIT